MPIPNGDNIVFIASIILKNKRGGKESENEQTTGWSYMGIRGNDPGLAY